MKVGKVIKIKAVEVNRLLFLIGVLWLPVLLLSCSDENDEQRIDEEQKEGIRVDFGNEVGYTPEDLKNWPHALFVFENKECVEVQESSDNASLFVSSVGDRMVALAYESKENLSWGSMASGVPLSSYHLSVKDVNEDMDGTDDGCSRRREYIVVETGHFCYESGFCTCSRSVRIAFFCVAGDGKSGKSLFR